MNIYIYICAFFILACCDCVGHLLHVLNDLLFELPFAASNKGLGIVFKCETASCKQTISNYMVFFANIMDIAQYCVYIGDNFFHRSIMKRKKFLCKHELGFLKIDGALISYHFFSGPAAASILPLACGPAEA